MSMKLRASPQAQPMLRPPRFLTLRSVTALMLREMSATYGKSPGGYIWAVVQPIGIILVLSVGFSLLLRTPSLGTNFLLFYATGYLPFDIYATMASKIAQSLNYSRALLAYPRVTWLDAVLARFFLNLLTLTTVFCLLITGILLAVDTRTVIDIGPIITGIILAAGLGLGVGMMNCLLGGLFPVWDIIWGMISRPLFLASGVFFLYEDMPATVQNILWWNPLLHVTGWLRTGFYPTYHAPYVALPYVVGVILILITLGLVFLRGNYKAILQK